MLKRTLSHKRSRELATHRAQTTKVGVAVAKEKMRRHMIDIGISIYLRDTGEPAGDLLGHLAWMLAIGTEIEIRRDPEQAKQMHSALRTVVQLSAGGNRWDASQASNLYQAAERAKEVMVANPLHGVELVSDADYIACHCERGTATLAMVAGDEVYESGECVQPSQELAAGGGAQ